MRIQEIPSPLIFSLVDVQPKRIYEYNLWRNAIFPMAYPYSLTLYPPCGRNVDTVTAKGTVMTKMPAADFHL
jgi:hypothetical protein